MQEFPIFKTKMKGRTPSFNLTDPRERRAYFELKAGKEIKKLRNYLKKGNTFIAYLLGKKNSGKGTFSKLFMEAVDAERIAQISIGDLVRKTHQEIMDRTKKKKLIDFLGQNYRGYIPVEDTIESLLNRSTETLLPTEFILALIKREIAGMPKRALFIDGFPRDLDQVSYSLFFRDLIYYREDPDIFVLISVPEEVINERIKWRVICPNCQNSKNLKLNPVQSIRYNEKKKDFYFVCDNPSCKDIKMLPKEGDELGIKPIRKRLQLDEKLIRQAFSLHGIPHVFLRNSIPAKDVKKYVDDYEITPEYFYEWDARNKKVKIIEKPWIIKDDSGIPSNSLLPHPVVVSMIKQISDIIS